MKIAIIGSGGVGGFPTGAPVKSDVRTHIVSTQCHVDVTAPNGLHALSGESLAVTRRHLERHHV